MVDFVLETLAKVACIGLIIFQGSMLNAYLSMLYSYWWWLWQIADVCVVVIWIITLIYAKRRYLQAEKRRKDAVDGGRDPEKQPDEIKFAFIAWVAYTLLLCPRVVILFHKHASKLEENNVLGPNYLKVAVSCTPLIFMALVYGHHNAKPHTSRKYYIQSLVGGITLDLFDSIDILEFLFIPDGRRKFPQSYLDAALAFACINFFLPVLALVEVRVNNFTGRVTSLPFKLLYVCCYVFLVNFPNLIIRSILWHKYDANVSVLIMKNVMCITLGILEILEYTGENQPIKCERCLDYYKMSHLKKHKESCAVNETTLLDEQL